MLIHLPIVIVASLHATPVADAVPHFDITRECRVEGGNKKIQDGCAADEKQALNQLKREWKQFGASAKAHCRRETNIAGAPSYVELLTCLEITRQDKNTLK